jgi:hypothetical protein
MCNRRLLRILAESNEMSLIVKVERVLGVVIALTSLVLSSCSDMGNPIPPAQTPQSPMVLVPLTIGNSWSFHVTTFDTTGTVVWVDTLAFFIRTDTVVDDVRWYLQGYYGVMIGQLGFRNDDVGHHQINFEGWQHNFPYPAQRGQIYENWIVESVDSLLATPLGQLHCYVYRYSWLGHPGRMIFAPGIGTIHTDNVGRTWGGTVWLAQTMDLVAATILDSTTALKPCSHNNTISSSILNTRRLLHITRPTTALPFVERE